MKERHRIAVRTLVDKVLRSGDLDTRFSAPGRRLDGIRIHQAVQRRRPEEYRAEVPVSIEVETEDLILVVGGRIDGVIDMAGETIVEEIKSTGKDLKQVAQTRDPCHWGQAKVYAHLLAVTEQLCSVTVRLTYCHLDSGETIELAESNTAAELERFFNQLVDQYLKWAATLSQWRKHRDESIMALEFPFPSYRNGQRDMAVTVYRTIRDGGQALIQAATGIGKTMAVLFSAIKAIGEAHTDRLFFLTARNTGKVAATDALNLLQGIGLRLKRVVLTAKEQICANLDMTCTPDLCPYAKGHFDRLSAALDAAFEHDNLDRETIEDVARSHRVCPFEFSLELALWADCIVCDYNYAFDPRVYLRRFFEEESGAYAFLVDEAHNLVDRSREMFSAQLSKDAFLILRRAVKSHLTSVYRSAGRINTWMVKARKLAQTAGGFLSDPRPPDGLDPLLRGFVRNAERWLVKNLATPYRDLLLERYYEINAFLRIWEQYDGSYVTCYEASGKQMHLKLFCLDPSHHLMTALNRSRAAIFFSATLTPAGYFQKILGCDPSAAKLAVPSPFPRRHLRVFLANGISTYYTQREHSVDGIAEMIDAFVRSKKGNYLCFFPSYNYLEMVISRFETQAQDLRLIAQTRDMDEAERLRFLGRFAQQDRSPLVGFAVMGGVFGEGIDLVGERLSGAVIVGVGLPAICPQRELIRRYFGDSGSGFDFAYRYPGINRVLQAAGRVIRSDQDRGAILMVDRRFTTSAYRELLPPHWTTEVVGSRQELETGLKQFWNLENLGQAEVTSDC